MILTKGYFNSFTKKLNNLTIKNKLIKISKNSKLINSGVYLFSKNLINVVNKNKLKKNIFRK